MSKRLRTAPIPLWVGVVFFVGWRRSDRLRRRLLGLGEQQTHCGGAGELQSPCPLIFTALLLRVPSQLAQKQALPSRVGWCTLVLVREEQKTASTTSPHVALLPVSSKRFWHTVRPLLECGDSLPLSQKKRHVAVSHARPSRSPFFDNSIVPSKQGPAGGHSPHACRFSMRALCTNPRRKSDCPAFCSPAPPAFSRKIPATHRERNSLPRFHLRRLPLTQFPFLHSPRKRTGGNCKI